MLILYDSLTGNVQRFVNKLQGFESQKIRPDLIVKEPFVLITYTIGFGEAPESVLDFLEWNHEHLKGVAASGNKIWGNNYTKSSEVISELYNVPILHRFELSGTDRDVAIFTQEVGMLDE